jgi:hypothetical protein
MTQIYDIALTKVKTNNSHRLVASLPVRVSLAMLERGYNRATLEITEDGILFRPYKSERGSSHALLPDWDDPSG